MIATVDKSALATDDGGRTVAPCKVHGDEAVHCRASHVDDSKWACLACMAAAVPGSIPGVAEKSGMMFRVNPNNNVPVLYLHFTADPDKNPALGAKGKAWHKRKMREFAQKPWDFKRQYDIDFIGQGGPRIYPEFSPDINLDPSVDYDPNYPLLASFDWGIRHAALTFSQWIDNRLIVLVEMLGENAPTSHFGLWASRMLRVRFFRDMPSILPDEIEKLQEEGKLDCYGDPAGNNRQAISGESDIRFIRSLGWIIRSTVARPKRKIEKVRSLTLVPDGHSKPRLILRGESYRLRGQNNPHRVDPRSQGTLLSGFLGGYHYKTNAKGEVQQPPEPDKNIHSHLMDTVAEVVENTYDFDTGVEPRLSRRTRFDATVIDLAEVASRRDKAQSALRWYFDPESIPLNEEIENGASHFY